MTRITEGHLARHYQGLKGGRDERDGVESAGPLRRQAMGGTVPRTDGDPGGTVRDIGDLGRDLPGLQRIRRRPQQGHLPVRQVPAHRLPTMLALLVLVLLHSFQRFFVESVASSGGQGLITPSQWSRITCRPGECESGAQQVVGA
jgi:hypothetical protein